MRIRLTLSAACLIGLLLGAVTATIAPPDAVAAQATAGPVLAEGTGMAARPSDRVRALQERLKREGYRLGPAGVDGRFGPFTRRAVQRLQRNYGLEPDGVAGPKTRKLLRGLERASGNRSSGKREARETAARAGTGSGSGHWLEIALAGLAAVLGLLLAWTFASRRRERRDPMTVVPIDYELEVEGLSWSLGRFSGRALALAYGGTLTGAQSPRVMYLVSDREKPGPAWVRVEEIARLTLPRPRVIGYVGAPEAVTPRGDDDDAQELAIWDECRRRGWDLVDVLHEVAGGDSEALDYALERVKAGDAPSLVVSSLARMNGSPSQMRELLRWFSETGRTLIVLDAGIDTSTPEGRHAARVLASAPDWRPDEPIKVKRRLRSVD